MSVITPLTNYFTKILTFDTLPFVAEWGLSKL